MFFLRVCDGYCKFHCLPLIYYGNMVKYHCLGVSAWKSHKLLVFEWDLGTYCNLCIWALIWADLLPYHEYMSVISHLYSAMEWSNSFNMKEIELLWGVETAAFCHILQTWYCIVVVPTAQRVFASLSWLSECLTERSHQGYRINDSGFIAYNFQRE